MFWNLLILFSPDQETAMFVGSFHSFLLGNVFTKHIMSISVLTARRVLLFPGLSTL